MIDENIKPIVIDMTPDDESGFRKLARGRLAAVYSNREVGYELLKRLGLDKKIRYAGTHRKLKYYIGFTAAHTDATITRRFDESYRILRDRGVVAEILHQYHMGAPPPE